METEIGWVWAGHVFSDGSSRALCRRCGIERSEHDAAPHYCPAAREYLAPGADAKRLWEKEQRGERHGDDGIIITGPPA